MAIHDPQMASFNLMDGKFPMEDVAFFSEVYVHLNRNPKTDSKPTPSHPSGFYIVGFKDGRVTTAPVDQVRPVYATHQRHDPSGSRRVALLFPGSAHYDQAFEKAKELP